MRKKFVAGNWKMYTSAATAQQLAAGVVQGLDGDDRVTVALCPPFPYLGIVHHALKGSKVALGGQNLYPEKEGAFTGEVSPLMLLDQGCKYVILGHSERRHKMSESDTFVNQKVKAALAAGLHPILCVGETLDERHASRTHEILDRHITEGLKGVSEADMALMTVAYEPVWAIGTGQNATPEQAQDAHAFLRRRVQELYSEITAHALVIQYGGSVKPDNAATLFAMPDVDGGLIGGASLKPDTFLGIVRAGVQ